MQLTIDSNPITTQGLTSIGKSTIRDEDMRIALSVLRDRLYSDPIKSICREIMSNALDANKEVGNNKPIEITLPTSFNPTLLIRDDGPGLSPDRMENFKNFFSSSKRDSNSQRGAFGLGSKSPWSYTSSYSIITIHNGIEYNYTCVIDETGQGDTFLAFSKPTTKSNGTTISIPIKAKDCITFKEAVLYYSRFFKPTPIIINNPGSIYPIPDFKDYILLPDVDPTIIVGDVPYPLEQNQFQGMAGYEDFKYVISRNDYSRNNQLSLVIRVDIGEVSLIPSREAILYDSKTKTVLGHKLNTCFKEAIKEEVNKIQMASTYKNALDLFGALTNKLSSDLSRKLDVRYKGTKIKSRINQEHRQASFTSRGQFRSENSKSSLSLNEAIYIDCEDVRVRNKACRALLKTTHKYTNVYLIPPDLTEVDDIPLSLLDLPRIDEVDVEQLLKDNNLTVVDVEPEAKEKTKPLKAKVSAKTNIAAYNIIANRVVNSNRKGIYKYLEPVELPIDTPWPYIIVDGGLIIDGVPKGMSDIDDFLSLMKHTNLGIKALKPDVAKKVTKWSLANDLIDKHLDNLAKTYEDYFIHELHHRSGLQYCSLSSTLSKVRATCGNLGLTNSFTDLWDYWAKIQANIDNLKDADKIRRWLLITNRLEPILNNISLGKGSKELVTRFSEEYPLLSAMLHRCNDNNSVKLAEVIIEELKYGRRVKTNP